MVFYSKEPRSLQFEHQFMAARSAMLDIAGDRPFRFPAADDVYIFLFSSLNRRGDCLVDRHRTLSHVRGYKMQ